MDLLNRNSIFFMFKSVDFYFSSECICKSIAWVWVNESQWFVLYYDDVKLFICIFNILVLILHNLFTEKFKMFFSSWGDDNCIIIALGISLISLTFSVVQFNFLVLEKYINIFTCVLKGVVLYFYSPHFLPQFFWSFKT